MPINSEKFTETDLVFMICGDAIDRDKALHYIYAHSGWLKEAKKGLQDRGVSSHDTKDALQEALITLDKHVRNGTFDKNKSLKQYFWGICKGKVYVQQRSQKRTKNQEFLPDETVFETPETEILDIEKKDILNRLLKQLGDKCHDVLTHYMLSFSMKEIKVELGIKNENLTRKTAFDCRQKLATMIDNNPSLKRYFKN